MRKIKIAGVVFLLIILTGCVVFLPWFMSRQNEKSMLSETVSWHYDAQNRAEITGKQVAQLCYKDDFSVYDRGEYSPSLESLKEVVDTVFASDEPLCEQMETILIDNSSCESYNGFTMVDNRPYVLNFVQVFPYADNYKIDFTYEEKTKTLVGFYYYSWLDTDDIADEEIEWLDRLQSALEAYYRDRIGLDTEMFYSHYEIFDGTITISAGINQGGWYEDDYEKIGAEAEIYGSDTEY